MRVFCPNCGSQNEATPGSRANCTACAAAFDVPGDVGAGAPPPSRATDFGATAPRQPQPPFAAPQPPFQPPFATNPQPGAVNAMRPVSGAKTNTMAIVSMVLGIVCCVPFLSSFGAIGLGLLAMQQIDRSNGAEKGKELAIIGLVLGVIGVGVWVLWLIGILTGAH